MHMRETGSVAIVLFCCALPAVHAYHVDSEAGNDANDGASPEQAWKTFDPVNNEVCGLAIMCSSKLDRTSRASSSCKAQAAAARPITIDMYGSGPMPRIEGQGAFLDAVLFRNVEYVEISNLEISNSGPERAAGRTGLRLVSDAGGSLHGIRLSNLFVHEVNGDLRKNQEGCGIFFESRNGSSFDGLTYRKLPCRPHRSQRHLPAHRRPRAQHERHHPQQSPGRHRRRRRSKSGAPMVRLVECNVIKGGRMRRQDAAAGIWPFDADDTVIQYNDVSGMKGTLDGQGFDSDYRCHRTLIQYNFSHENEGGFILICAPGTSSSARAQSSATTSAKTTASTPPASFTFPAT